VFIELVRPLVEEMDYGQVGEPAIQSFTDDFTLTGYPSPTGSRYYRIQLVP